MPSLQQTSSAPRNASLRIAAHSKGVRFRRDGDRPPWIHRLDDGEFVDLYFSEGPTQRPLSARIRLDDSSPIELVASAESEEVQLLDAADTLRASIAPISQFHLRSNETTPPHHSFVSLHGGYLVISASGNRPRSPFGSAKPNDTASSRMDAPNLDAILGTVEESFAAQSAEYVHLQGSLDSIDARWLAKIGSAIKDRFNTLVSAELPVAPERDDLDLLYAEGLDAVSLPAGTLRQSVFDERYPARAAGGGYMRMRNAIDRAAEIFIAGAVSVILHEPVIDAQDLTAFVSQLAQQSIVPVISGQSGNAKDVEVQQTCLDVLSGLPSGAQLVENYHVAASPAWAVATEDSAQGGGLINALLALGGRRRVRVGLTSIRRRLRVRRVAESYDASGL